MQSLSRVLLQRQAYHIRRLEPHLPTLHTTSRQLATDRRAGKFGRSDSTTDKEDAAKDGDTLFSPENISDLSPLEIARLRVTYGLVKEHVEALEQNIDAVEPETNPMIDPRSFDIKKLPKLPQEILTQFRKEVPPSVAAVSRPVSTQGIWDAPKAGEPTQTNPELRGDRATEWAVVDERTMEARQFSRMQRQAFTGPTDVTFRSDAYTPRRRKKICPLQDERGRVKVDFRAVGTLTPYLSDNAKILPKRKSGLSAKAQRKVSKAVKTARTMALLNPEPKPALTYEELVELERSLK